MKQIIKTEGIVLKTSDYKEQAVLATILTKEGINNYIIRGAKKISSGTRLLSSPLTKLEFNRTNFDTLNTLTEGNILNNYLPIKQNINKLMCAYPILEKIITFSEQVTNKVTYYNFVSTILDLLASDLDENAILTIFETKLTFLLGINPEFKICLNCGRETKSGVFSINDGGIICDECNVLIDYELTKEQTEIFKLIYLIKLEKINLDFINYIKPHIIQISNILDRYYNTHLDFYSKSKKVINNMK